MEIKLKSELTQARRLFSKYETGTVNKAAARALNRVAESAQSQGVKAIAEKTGLKQKDVRSIFKLSRATWSRLQAIVSARGRTFNLIRMNPKPTAKGFRYRAWDGKTYEARGAFKVNETWIARRDTKSGKFIRSRKKANKHGQALVPMYGPAPARTFAQPYIMEPLVRMIRERFGLQFERELSYYLSRQ